MIGDILTEEDLQPLAATNRRENLIQWLKDNNVPHLVARSGWPRVHRSALAQAMGVSVRPDSMSKEVEFNLDGLR